MQTQLGSEQVRLINIQDQRCWSPGLRTRKTMVTLAGAWITL